jgi:phosphatidylglycerophosphate synthase
MDKKIYSKIRAFYKYIFSSITPILVKEEIHTNFFSFAVFGLTLLFAVLMMVDNTLQASFAALLIAACDILGSLVADELKAKTTKEALIDSIVDRFSEVIFYTSAVVMLIQAGEDLYATFVYIAMIGSLMTSFVILRSKDFGISSEWGFIKRSERFLLVAIGLFFGKTGLAVSAFIIAVLANYTVVLLMCRIWLKKA